MDNATQYMQGNFQNPFGNSPQANNPQPTWGQQSYDPMALQASPQTQARSNTPSPVSAAQPVPPPAQGTPYNPQAQSQSLPPVPSAPAPAASPSGGEDPIAAREKAVSAKDTDLPRSTGQQAKLQQIDEEIQKWERATYGTRTGGGPPASYYQQIRSLKRLRDQALAGNPEALAWNPKTKAPPPVPMRIVPTNRRGRAARFGGLMQNGDNRR